MFKAFVTIALAIAFLCTAANAATATFTLTKAITTTETACVAKRFQTVASNTNIQYVRKITASATSSDVKYLTLWTCPETDPFTERDVYTCNSDLADRSTCRIVFNWEYGSGASIDLNQVSEFLYFKSGEGQFLDNLILEAKLTGTGTKTGSITLEYFEDPLTPVNGGVFTVGVSPDKISLEQNQVNAFENNFCTDDCSKGDITIFGVSAHMHQYGRSIETQLLEDGIHKKTLVLNTNFQNTDSATNIVSTSIFTNITTKQGFAFTTRCTYDTSLAGSTVTGGNTLSNEICSAYVLYTPFEHGPKTCVNNVCSNSQNTLRFRGNVIVNYIAAALAAFIIGFMVGIIAHIIYAYLWGKLEDWLERRRERKEEQRKKRQEALRNPNSKLNNPNIEKEQLLKEEDKELEEMNIKDVKVTVH